MLALQQKAPRHYKAAAIRNLFAMLNNRLEARLIKQRYNFDGATFASVTEKYNLLPTCKEDEFRESRQ